MSFQSACEQELDKVLEEISRMTSEDNRGPLENLYGLKFPNCDKHGLYNLKQVSRGQSTGPTSLLLIWTHTLFIE